MQRGYYSRGNPYIGTGENVGGYRGPRRGRGFPPSTRGQEMCSFPNSHNFDGRFTRPPSRSRGGRWRNPNPYSTSSDYSGTSSGTPQPKLGYMRLTEILKTDADVATAELSRFSEDLTEFVSQDRFENKGLLMLFIQVVGEKLCSEDCNIEEVRNPLLVKLCNQKFMKHLRDLTYEFLEIFLSGHSWQSKGSPNKDDNEDITSMLKVFSNLLSFYDLVWTTNPKLSVDRLLGNVQVAVVVTKSLEQQIKSDVASLSKLEKQFSRLEAFMKEYNKMQNDEALNKMSESKRRSCKTEKVSTKEMKLYLEVPPEDFRDIPIAPQMSDLLNERPFLRPNIATGSYPSADVYLDVQFRLLREDFLEPFRNGVIEYCKHWQEYSSGTKRMPFGTVRLYNNVRVYEAKLDGETSIFSLCFGWNAFQNINWEKSKRLIVGSLLCLTPDNFQTIYLATVATRNLNDLKRGIIDVTWEDEVPNFRETSTSYLMIECEVYFEAYRHTLKALQEIELDDFLMKKYIIDVTSGAIPPPKYLLEGQKPADFSLMLKKKDKNAIKILQEKMIQYYSMSRLLQSEDVRDIRGSRNPIFGQMVHPEELWNAGIPVLGTLLWPKAKDLRMDDSQYRAFQCAITKELSVIQGPPGTGKTYIGLQVVKLFLSNPQIYKTDAPIIIVCYTNHALDQFLEGIIEVMNDLKIDSDEHLIRLGTRSKSDELQKYGIYARMQDARLHHKLPTSYLTTRGIIRTKLDEHQESRRQLSALLSGLENINGIIDFNKIPEEHLLKDCPKSLSDTILGVWKSQRLPDTLFFPQKLVHWLGLQNNFGRYQNYNPEFHLKKLFTVTEGMPKIWNAAVETQTTFSSTGDSEDLHFVERDYEMDELMAHRIESLRQKREDLNRR